MLLCPSKVVWSTQGRPRPDSSKSWLDLKLCFPYLFKNQQTNTIICDLFFFETYFKRHFLGINCCSFCTSGPHPEGPYKHLPREKRTQAQADQTRTESRNQILNTVSTDCMLPDNLETNPLFNLGLFFFIKIN